MRLELRSSSDKVCHNCGSHELLKIRRNVTAYVESLAVDLDLELKLPRWAFLRRRTLERALLKLEEAEERLLDSSRYPLVDDDEQKEAP